MPSPLRILVQHSGDLMLGGQVGAVCLFLCHLPGWAALRSVRTLDNGLESHRKQVQGRSTMSKDIAAWQMPSCPPWPRNKYHYTLCPVLCSAETCP